MSFHQQVLSPYTKSGKFFQVKGKGLIRPLNLSNKLKRMSIGEGSPARKHIEAEMGGSVKHHNRPYQLKDMEVKTKTHKGYSPIHFKI